jgi:polyhydroxyalkanoate synthase
VIVKLIDMNVLTTAPASAKPKALPPIDQADQEATKFNLLDMQWQGGIAKITGGVSPIALSLAFQDWFMHLAASPGKRIELMAGLNCPVDVMGDARFAGSDWRTWPFNLLANAFVGTEQFWQQATTGVRGVAPHHAQVVNFMARQVLDVFSPSNFSWSNPEVVGAAIDRRGHNYTAGWANWREDLNRLQPKRSDTQRGRFVVGVDVAKTPGMVVYRNELVELIQYTPQNATVYREPILIVSSWILKYYILDLSAHNSMVRYLVQQGHTVFMISWRNPDAHDRNLGMDDYLSLGLMDVLDEVVRIGGVEQVHAVGYCLGGTLLALAAAALGSGRQASTAQLKSVTLLAAQTDFSEPGALGVFIDDSELALLEALMWEQGYLDGDQMGASFQLLNASELIWSRMMREYMLGIRPDTNDLAAWNGDTTRMPYRMHSEYLRRLFLNNDLAAGRYCVDGKPLVLKDIKAPLFVLGTERDHVAPWRSVYKIHLLSNTVVEFVLASGGHNAGIVAQPGHLRRSYQFMPPRPAGSAYVGPDEWLQAAVQAEGSWWPHWQQWLAAHSAAERTAPPVMGAGMTLALAPGLYVLGN